jgi:putative membrane protein
MTMLLHPTTLAAAVQLGDVLDQITVAALFALLGMALFGLAWFIVVKISPFSIRKEIEEDQNTSLGIILGCVILGISIIIAAAVSG